MFGVWISGSYLMVLDLEHLNLELVSDLDIRI